jgi:tRNA threonylcarbamoyladenosine biosynthesis protein TsaE
MKQFVVQSIDELQKVAEEIIPYIIKQPVVAFQGKMGAGKTTLIKVICKAMDVQNTVTSPTFSLVNEYKTLSGQTIYHFDFYRINKVEEIYDFGYEEYFYSGKFCFIEWPELAEQLLLPDTLVIKIDVDAKHRRTISLSSIIVKEQIPV